MRLQVDKEILPSNFSQISIGIAVHFQGQMIEISLLYCNSKTARLIAMYYCIDVHSDNQTDVVKFWVRSQMLFTFLFMSASLNCIVYPIHNAPLERRVPKICWLSCLFVRFPAFSDRVSDRLCSERAADCFQVFVFSWERSRFASLTDLNGVSC